MAEIVVRLDADSIDALKAFSGGGGPGGGGPGGGGGGGGRPPKTADPFGLKPFVDTTKNFSKIFSEIGTGIEEAFAAILTPVGVVVAAILLLVATLLVGIGNSKIIGVFIKTVGDALGLLVDLVLLPFLPLLAWGITQLFLAIIGFNKWWTGIWETIKKEGLVGLIKMGLKWLLEQLPLWLQSILEWFFSDKPLPDKIIELGLFLANFLLLGLVGVFLNIIPAILDFIFGEGTAEKWKKIGIELGMRLLTDPLGWLAYAFGYVFGVNIAVAEKVINIGLDIINKALQSIWDFAVWIFEVLTGKKKINVIDILLNLIPKNLSFWDTVNWLKGAGSSVLNNLTLGAAAGYQDTKKATAAEGGYVSKSGLAVIHKGETFSGTQGQVPIGTGTGGNTFNFYGYQDDKFIGKVKEVLRQEGARYQI